MTGRPRIQLARRKAQRVDGAALLGFQMRAAGLNPVAEFRFSPDRHWRSDYAFPEPDKMLLIEFEGVTYFGKNKDGSMRLGRHQSAKGYVRDIEKYNAAALLGYRVLRFSADMVTSGRALQTIEEALR